MNCYFIKSQLSLIVKILLAERFWAVFQKNALLKKKCGTVTKGQSSVKNAIINQICLEYLRNILYDSFFGTLALALQCCCGVNVKYGPLSKCLFPRKQEHGCCWKKIQGNNKLSLKIIFFTYQME